jgi:hypothetical protein
VAWHTIGMQWHQIAADLDSGIPAALGVVTVASASPADLGVNHQVLAYGYSASASQVTVQVYDPNSGRNDGIYIKFDPRAPAKPTTFAHNLNIARPVRGFFRTPYSPATPPGRQIPRSLDTGTHEPQPPAITPRAPRIPGTGP